MKTTVSRILVFVSLIALMYGCSGSGGVSPDYSKYREQLKVQMRDMSNTLDAGHYSEFLSKYVDPSYISSMGGVDAALLQFGSKRQQALYGALRIARNVEPLYDSKKQVMNYVSNELPQPVTFKMSNNKWYLTSDWLR